jgi:hypothetical protein
MCFGFQRSGCVEEQVFFEPVISRFKYQAVDGDEIVVWVVIRFVCCCCVG